MKPRAIDRDVLAKFFRGLGDPSRLAILLRLREGPLCVSDVAAATGLSQPNASMHLACLWECGLVEREPDWRSVYYRLASKRVTRLLAMAEAFLATNGHQIECCQRYRGSQSREPEPDPRKPRSPRRFRQPRPRPGSVAGTPPPPAESGT